MEQNNVKSEDDDSDEKSTNQIKLKAQEIAKRLEKFQSRYNISSSRCNTPLPITAADSMESMNSNNFIPDTSEKVILLRQFLENDRKLVEVNKIDEQKYNKDTEANNDIQLQNKEGKQTSAYYENIIEAQFNEKVIQSLKDQIVELNKKLENCHHIINEKDIILQSNIDEILLLNKTIKENNRSHLEYVESIKKGNIEIINEERLRSTQKINHNEDEIEALKNNLDYVHRVYDELKKNNIKINKENNELRKKEAYLKSEIEKLISNYENEKQLLLQQNYESSRKSIEDIENKLLLLQQENDLLKNHITLLENKSKNTQENDELLVKLNIKETEIHHLNIEKNKLSEDYENLTIEVQKTSDRWSQLKDAYLNDKNRMIFLEKVIEELKMNNDELNSTNIKLTEDIEKSMKNLTTLKTENCVNQERITDLTAVIGNMREQFEKALKEASVECEKDKMQLIQQHQNDKISLEKCHNTINEYTSQLNKVTDQLNFILKQNDSYKCESLELKNCISKNNAEVLELNDIISKLQNQIYQMTNEFEFLKKENVILSDKIKGTTLEKEDSKLLSERFQKQKQLLKLKVKALKESENNCLRLQQEVMFLTDKMQNLNKKSEFLDKNNKQISTILQYCDIELQNCYEFLNQIVLKSNLQNKTINSLHCLLRSLASLFYFNCNSDGHLVEIVDSIANNISNNTEFQIYLKRIILGSVQMLEYIINLKNIHQISTAQLIARTEVDKLVFEAIEKVKLSTQNEYQIQNNELLSLIENLQNDNHILKLSVDSKNKILENKEVLTDLNGPTVTSLISINISDVENIKNENNTLKQFLKNIQDNLGLVSIKDTNNVQLLRSLNELELIIQEIKNENVLLKNQYLKQQKPLMLKTLKHSVEQQIDNDSNVNMQNTFIQSIENVEDNCGDGEKASLTSESSEHDLEKSNPASDSKMLLVRYKNLKSKFKEVRSRTIELDNKIISLTNDLEMANFKYKQLNDQYINCNETHETDIINCQSEIENLMMEKLEAYRQLASLREKHEILQNDYDQLKSNLEEKIPLNEDETFIHTNEQNTILKEQLNNLQHLIDSAYSRVLCKWPDTDKNSDWVIAQSKKLNEIITAKCNLSSSDNSDFDLNQLEIKQIKSCVKIIHELVSSILTNKCNIEASFNNELVELMTDLKSCTETFLEFISVKNGDFSLVNERHIQLSDHAENYDINTFLSKQYLNAEEKSITELLTPPTEETSKSSLMGNEENKQLHRAIDERDRLIEFLTEKISKVDNLSRSVDDIRLIRDKLDRALTAVHERDVRCDELTLELTRLLEERDMLQLKLSNSIRQIQFLSDNKSQCDTSKMLKEKYDPKTIDDKLEELHSLEYKRDADLFTDQEQRHKSQMELHQGHQDNLKTKTQSSNTLEETNASQSWFKDLLW